MTPKYAEKTLSVCFLIFGILSIPVSLLITLSSHSVDDKLIGVFIGLWAPTLISLANYLKNN